MTDQTYFQYYFRTSYEAVEEELKNLSREWNDHIAKNFPELKKENKLFTRSFFGGKMLRGILVKLGYELVRINHKDRILKPAAAFEILHTALLIHDDIIDRSTLRRGKPALHMMSQDKHRGLSQAICLGDLGIVWATTLIAESDFPAERKNRALKLFLQITKDTILGEMLDVEAAHSMQRSERQILKIHKMKTAYYTIIGPLSLGAILGNASDEIIKSIQLFGQDLGIAYQLQDDILGIFGDEQMLGKSTTSDIEENKNSLLFTYALAHASPEQRMTLTKYYGKKGITPAQYEKIKHIFRSTGALMYSQNKIESLTAQAKGFIPQLTEKKKNQQLLLKLIDSLITRIK